MMKNKIIVSLCGALLLTITACSGTNNKPAPVSTPPVATPLAVDAGNDAAQENDAGVDPSVSELKNQEDDVSQTVFDQTDWALTLPDIGWRKNQSEFGLDLINDQYHNRVAFIGVSEVPPGMNNIKVADFTISRIVDLSDSDVKIERNPKTTIIHSNTEWLLSKIHTNMGDITVWNTLKNDKAFILLCGGMYEPTDTSSASWNNKTCQFVFDHLIIK